MHEGDTDDGREVAASATRSLGPPALLYGETILGQVRPGQVRTSLTNRPRVAPGPHRAGSVMDTTLIDAERPTALPDVAAPSPPQLPVEARTRIRERLPREWSVSGQFEVDWEIAGAMEAGRD